MKESHTIHKFILNKFTPTEIKLERDAAVLYAARDSVRDEPAIWVLRRLGLMSEETRYFHVVPTGQPFAPVTKRGKRFCPWKSIGLVCLLDQTVWHVFEEEET